MTISDKNGNLIDRCEGETIKTEHFVILKNCSFEHGLKPLYKYNSFKDGYVNNICVWQDDENVGIEIDYSFGNYTADYFVENEYNLE